MITQILNKKRAKQTQLSQDTTSFAIAGSSNVTIQPAVGEFDLVSWGIANQNNMRLRLTDGTNFTTDMGNGADKVLNTSGCTGNTLSTNIISVNFNNVSGGELSPNRVIITQSEQA